MSLEKLNLGRRRIDGEWIVAKKDWQEVKKRQKTKGSSGMSMSMDNASPPGSGPQAEYKPEMDEMRCILYAHGGTFVCE